MNRRRSNVSPMAGALIEVLEDQVRTLEERLAQRDAQLKYWKDKSLNKGK